MLRQLCAFFALITALGSPTMSLGDELCERAVEDAQKAFAREDYKGSISIIDRAFNVMVNDKRVRLDDEVGPLYIRRAMAKELLKNWAGALADYQDAVKLMPGNISALNGVAWIAATAADPKLRDGVTAVSCVMKALAAVEKNNFIALIILGEGETAANVWDTAAAAHAEVGEFKKAVAYQKQAQEAMEATVSMLKQQGRSIEDGRRLDRCVIELRNYGRRMELYRSSKPYREE